MPRSRLDLSWQRKMVARIRADGNELFWLGHSPSKIMSASCRHLEGNEPYRNLFELWQWLANREMPENIQHAQAIIKALYQIEYSLNRYTPTACQKDTIVEFTRSIKGTCFDGICLDNIEYISTGELVDRTRMIPLTNGVRVVQPLGVVLVSNNTIVSKARVLCG